MRRAVVKTLSEVGEYGVQLKGGSTLLTDLEQLRKHSLRLLEKIGRDTHSRQLEASCELILDPDARIERMLVFVGSQAPLLKLKWLKWCFEQGTEILVVADRHATAAPIFKFSEGLEEALNAQAVEMGAGNLLQNKLFATEDHGGPDIPVTIASAPDMLAECEWAVRGCLKAENSCAIYARDLASYGPLLKASADRLGLKLHIPVRVNLLENAFARLTLQLLEAIAGSDVRALLPVFKSSYLPLNNEQRTAISAALKDARSRKKAQWDELATWAANAGDEFAWIAPILEWRTNSAEISTSLAEWTGKLSALIKDLPWFQSLGNQETYDRQRDSRACAVMRASLENEAVLGRITGAPHLSLSGFAARCAQTWATADVSVPSEEGIPVVNSAVALGGVNSLYVLGMLEGVFPKRRAEDPVLHDEERIALNGLPTSIDLAQAERDEFYRVCSAASESITFSYPRTEEDRDNIPAFYLQLLREITKVQDLTYSRLELTPALDFVSEADRSLREALAGPRCEPDSNEIHSIEAGMALHPAKDEPQRPDGLRDVLECPFRFQVRHRLHVPSRSRIARWIRLRRLPEWAGLASAPIDSASQLLESALDNELEALSYDVPDWELQLLRSGGNRLIREWVAREKKAREIWPRDLDSVQLNVPFGMHGTRKNFKKDRELDGKVPAVSSTGDGRRLLHLYGFGVPKPEEMTPSQKLYLGLWLSVGMSTSGVALEIESPDARRTLVVLTRDGIRHLNSRATEGLQIVDLSQSDDDSVARRVFAQEMKELIGKALARIDRGDITPTPGPHCETCDFGELCRRSTLFSDDNSPFGEDETVGAA
jgi:hypothetical protein